MGNSTVAYEFPFVAGREVLCVFNGGDITSDAGVMMVAAADKRCGLSRRLAEHVIERRYERKVRHSVSEMLSERIYAIAMGYEDANDLDSLRRDPAFKIACAKRPASKECLASQPTISRLDNSVGRKELFKMGMDMASLVVSQLPADTKEVILDIDATDDPCHGQQELILFDGHYGAYCYLPLYMYITDQTGRQRLMGTLLRSACGRSTKGVMSFVRLAVRTVRLRFPDIRIIVRGDCGFGFGQLMNWCDSQGVGYVLAFQSTKTSAEMALPIQMEVARKHWYAGDGCREYGDFNYQGRTWSCARRLIIKTEVSGPVVDTRNVVTSDTAKSAEEVYLWYTQRGDQENRIKEMKLGLASGRTSCHRFLANQFRLLLHSAACVLMGLLQAALAGTRWSNAQVGTLRLRLLKLGARVVQTCRRIWFHLPTSFPDQKTWEQMHRNLVFR